MSASFNHKPHCSIICPPSWLVLLAVAFSILSGACSSGGMEAPLASDDEVILASGSRTADDALSLQCEVDNIRECLYYLPEHNGVRACIKGHQVCEEGTWGRCTEGALFDAGAN